MAIKADFHIFIGGNMGIQDRDYYWEKHKEIHQRSVRADSWANRQSNSKPYSSVQMHHCLPKRSTNNGKGVKYLLYPLFALLSLWYGANLWIEKITNARLAKSHVPVSQPPFASQSPVDVIPGGIILRTDRSGHFRGTALINNVTVPFLIDTGATQTSVPANLATAIGLPFGRAIQTNTAGGRVVDQLTKINSLKIGNAEIRNLDANINQHLTEVLIGMNTLKYFRMTQDSNTLTLVAYTRPEEIAEIERGLTAIPAPVQVTETSTYRVPVLPSASSFPDQKAKTTWKKSVVCDAQKNCKTIYGE
ncbi:MAG: retropepsin-like aspartic protease family protein [Methylomonas sp.]